MNEVGFNGSFGFSDDRCGALVLRILDVLKEEVQHEGHCIPMTAKDLLNKIVGLATELQLPDIREKALDYHEAGQRG